MLLGDSLSTPVPIKQKSAPVQSDPENTILSIQVENIVLKARLEEKENFIKMLLEKQDADIKPNIVSEVPARTSYSNSAQIERSVCAI